MNSPVSLQLQQQTVDQLHAELSRVGIVSLDQTVKGEAPINKLRRSRRLAADDSVTLMTLVDVDGVWYWQEGLATVQGKHLSVDGSFVEANAAKESRIRRQQLAEAAQVNQAVRQYLVEPRAGEPNDATARGSRPELDSNSRSRLPRSPLPSRRSNTSCRPGPCCPYHRASYPAQN
jgi:hypothetical protein